MFLSKLTLSPPPRCRQVLTDVASPYEMHRTLLRAFPGRDNGGPGRVLFRVEPDRPDRPPVVLVQSDKQPDWSALDPLDGYLSEPPETKPFAPGLRAGQRLRFRLRANPTVKRDGKRHGLFQEADQLAWLQRKGQAGGFRPVAVTLARKVELRSRATGTANHQAPQKHLAVDFEGILEVTNPEKLVETLAAGIGPAKGYGFGLLSIGPPR